MTTSYETVIVGAGLSGLAVATDLARLGAGGVAVVEAGGIGAAPPGGTHADTRAGADVARLLAGVDADADLPRWCPWTSAAAPHYAEPTGLRRRVGGRSLCWHGVVLRLAPWECDEATPWPRAVTRELFGADGGGLYASVEQDLADWVGGPLDRARTETEGHLREWAAGLGYGAVRHAPLAARDTGAPGTGELPAYSPLYTWPDEAARGNPLPDLLTDREVVAVRLRRGRVAGLDVRHRRSGVADFVPCARVVLAAGTIENTRLVAQATGRATPYAGLNDHIVQGFAVTVPARAWGPAHRDGGCLVLRGDSATRANLFFKVRGTPSPDHVTLDVWSMGEQVRSDENRISFTGTTALPWATAVTTGLSADDRQVVKAEQEILDEAWHRTATALGLPAPMLGFDEFLLNSQPIGTAYDISVSRPGMPVPFSAALGSIDHEAGSLPLGSVLDPTGAVPGCGELYVTGPAVFPRTGAANPSLTTLALARRLAAHLAGR